MYVNEIIAIKCPKFLHLLCKINITLHMINRIYLSIYLLFVNYEITFQGGSFFSENYSKGYETNVLHSHFSKF